MVSWDTLVKYLKNKFLVLTNIHDCTGYFIGFPFLENVVLIVFAVILASFKFIKRSIKAPFGFI